MMRLKGVCVWLFVLAFVSTTLGEDWPCLRGPRYDGIHQETGWQKTFRGKPKQLWQKNVGDAYSSFACVGDRLYTCGQPGGEQTVYCLNAKTGDVIWKQGFDRAHNDSHWGSGPRSTPTVDDGRVYVVGANGALVCLDAGSGRIQWKKQLGRKPKWGHGGSVLIEGNLAVVTAGSDAGAMVAYDKKTGEQIWAGGREKASYGTPYPFTFQGKRYIFGFMSRSFLIVDAKTGKVAVQTPWKTSHDVNAAFPIFKDGHLYVSSGYKVGAALYKLSAKGNRLVCREVWRTKRFENRFSSMVLYKGKLYGMSEGAVVCADFKTGDLDWRVRVRKYWGNAIIAAGPMLFYSPKGVLYIAKATPEGFKPMTKVAVQSGRCWTAPVLHDGRLYVRNQSTVVCLNLKP